MSHALLPVSALAFGLTLACSDSTGGLPGGDAGEATSDASGFRIDAGTPGDASLGPVTALRLAPADPRLEADLGVPAALDLELYASNAAGQEQRIELGAIWRADDDRIGGFLDETRGRFTANADRAGPARVTAHYAGLTAETTVRVMLRATQTAPGAPSDAATRFGGPTGQDPARVPAVAYPETQVVIPKNLLPMQVQWDAPADLDLFAVDLKSTQLNATIYTVDRSAALDATPWARLLESTAGAQFEIVVRGVSSTDPTVQTSAPTTVRVADGLMRGTIYYWALNIGRILRIQPGASVAEDFFTPPPNPSDNSTCTGCHTLSRDGRKMAFEYWGGWQWHGVVDVVSPMPPTIAPNVFQANFSAFDPTGDRLAGIFNGALTIFDARSGQGLETVAATSPASMPAWSPDGSVVAYAGGVTGQPFSDVDFFQSDLVVIRDFNGARTAPEILVPSDGQANTYPSFSPDGRTIAFSRGPYSRSHTSYDAGNPSGLSPSDLYLVPIDRSTPPVPLARASRGGQALLPAYSPFESGGHTWVAFFSRREYGHLTRGTNRRQIWVTAIDSSAPAGSDGSQPAFWLPGQDSGTENMSAYWAPDPCHLAGETCTLDEDCCGGPDGTAPGTLLCRPDSGGQRRCTSRETACRIEGEPCASTSECCTDMPLQCSATPEGDRCKRIDL